jgi:flagellar biosynthesis/type III secretory pathway protein FliH
MTLAQGRVLRRAERAADAPTPATRTHEGRRLPAALVHARHEAQRVLESAEHRAAAILADAQDRARRIEAAARAEGHEGGLALAAALALSLRQREERADEAALDRTLALARLLAERLLGEALLTSDVAVTQLARGTLAEARGARRVVFRAHPQDAALLTAATAQFDPDGRVQSIVPDAALGRGDFVLETEVGTVDARLGAGLDRLALRLREALRS